MVLTTRLFAQPGSGGELCTARLLRLLQQQGHDVQWVGRGDAVAARAAFGTPAWTLGPVSAAFQQLPVRAQAAGLALAILRREASSVQRLAAGGVGRRLARILADTGLPDVLIVDHLQCHAWLRLLPARLRACLPAPVLVMHNLESEGYDEQAAAAQGLARWILRREARLIARLEQQALHAAAAVLCLSTEDAASLARRLWPAGPIQRNDAPCPATPSLLVLPGFARPQPLLRRAGPGSRPRCIGVIGTWSWRPNRAALCWLLQQVLPQLESGCSLLVAGHGLERGLPVALLPDRAAQVVLAGRIEDLDDFYGRVDVVAVPSVCGSGVHEKAIEAIARAGAVVATTQALRGLGPWLPPHVHVADDAAGFAALCMQVPAAGLQQRQALRRWVAEREAACHAALRAALAAACGNARVRPPWPLASGQDGGSGALRARQQLPAGRG